MPDSNLKPQTERFGPPHNPRLRKLIEGKRRWHRPERTLAAPPEAGVMESGKLPAEAGVPSVCGTPASAGSVETPHSCRSSGSSTFLGWHERGYLPHFDAPWVTQFVTYMLQDSFPVSRQREWEGILHEPDGSQRRRKLEVWLDRGHGECWLRRAAVAAVVEEVLCKGDGKLYRLQAWAVMPNHVHVVVDVWATPLSRLIRGWKGASARAANLLLGRGGCFWERDYFDTLIRDAAHLQRAIGYTEKNPVKARLVAERKAWRWGSSRWRDQYERLPWQRAGTTA